MSYINYSQTSTTIGPIRCNVSHFGDQQAIWQIGRGQYNFSSKLEHLVKKRVLTGIHGPLLIGMAIGSTSRHSGLVCFRLTILLIATR